jgi:SAM-dependent methyltransferase
VPGLRFKSCEVVRCRECGLLRTFPQPDIDNLTANIYNAETSDKYSLTRDPTYDAASAAMAGRQLDALERHISPPGRLLDVGCDQGICLGEAALRGWEPEGVEVNAQLASAVTERTGIRIHTEPIETLNLPAASFDAVICNAVIEHVIDPNALLSEIRRVLRPGGVAMIGTSCFSSPIPVLLLRDRWYALVPSEHIWQFGPLTFRRMIRQNGLQVLRAERRCSNLSPKIDFSRPATVAAWLVFHAIAASRQGDFFRYIVTR